MEVEYLLARYEENKQFNSKLDTTYLFLTANIKLNQVLGNTTVLLYIPVIQLVPITEFHELVKLNPRTLDSRLLARISIPSLTYNAA